MTEPAPLLELADLRVSYGGSSFLGPLLKSDSRLPVRAVDGVSLSLKPGELLALVGESGSGKTTLALSALALEPATSGRVFYKGRDVAALSWRRMRNLRRRMQIVYQDPYEALDPRFTVRSIVGEPLAIHRIGSRRQRFSLITKALERVELAPASHFMERYPHELSGGQRQRVAIAAALVLEPELLVADEPVSMLDVSVRTGVLELVSRLRDEGLTVLMITHDLAVAAAYADRIAVMYLGRIVEIGPARDIIDDPRHPYTMALLSAVPSSDPVTPLTPVRLNGDIPSSRHIPTGCRFHPRCPVAIEQCSHIEPPRRSIRGRHDAWCILIREESTSDL